MVDDIGGRQAPLISVITPTFNRARYLQSCIDSVLAQTYTHWEHVIVDDGSTDDTPEVLAKLETNPKFRLFRQDNSGQSVARNRALGAARGAFVCFLDSDCRFRPHKLAEQVALLAAHPDVDVVYGDNEQIDEHGTSLGVRRRARPSGWITRALLVDNYVNFNSSMSRVESLRDVGGFDESVKVGDDYDLWLRVSAKHRFLYVPQVWSEYRVMDAQISSDKQRRFQSNQATIARFLATHPDLATDELTRHAWGSFFLRRARYENARGHKAAALGDLLRSLRYKPFSGGAWRGLARWAVPSRRAGGTES
jgi:glycosyltransferase involved in cell wall biosynthesis